MVLINLNTAHPAKMNDSTEKPIEVRFLKSIAWEPAIITGKLTY